MNTKKLCIQIGMGIILGVVVQTIIHLRDTRRDDVDRALRIPTKMESTAAVTSAMEQNVPFHWSSIESTNWLELQLNLRGIQCPEQTIHDILRSRIMTAYQRRINAVANPLFENWSSQVEMDAISEQYKVLLRDRDKAMADLGIEPIDSNGIVQKHKVHIEEAFKKYPDLTIHVASTESEIKASRAARKARIQMLSQFMTPEELLHYRMTKDGEASSVALTLGGVKMDTETFKQAFQALDGENLNQINGRIDPAVEAKLRQALGEEKFAEYLESMAPLNRMTRHFGMAHRLSTDQVDQLIQLQRQMEPSHPDFESAAANIINDGSAVSRFLERAQMIKRLNP